MRKLWKHKYTNIIPAHGIPMFCKDKRRFLDLLRVHERKKTKQSTGLNHSHGRFRLPSQTVILFFDILTLGTLCQCTLLLYSDSSIQKEAHWIRPIPLQRGMRTVRLILRLPEHGASWISWVYFFKRCSYNPPSLSVKLHWYLLFGHLKLFQKSLHLKKNVSASLFIVLLCLQIHYFFFYLF